MSYKLSQYMDQINKLKEFENSRKLKNKYPQFKLNIPPRITKKQYNYYCQFIKKRLEDPKYGTIKRKKKVITNDLAYTKKNDIEELNESLILTFD